MTAESEELRAAKRRIGELEAELATVKRATELFDKGRVVRPKDLFAIVETLASEGHGTKRERSIWRRWKAAAKTTARVVLPSPG